MQQGNSLGLHIDSIDGRTGDVGTWPVEAYDKTFLDGIAGHDHHGGNSRGCRLGGKRRWIATAGSDQCHVPPDQIRRHRRQPIIVSVRPAIFDLDVVTLDVAGIGQCVAERREIRFTSFGRKAREPPDHRHCLLRSRRERPNNRRATLMNFRRFTALTQSG